MRSHLVGLVAVGVIGQALNVVSGPLVARMLGPSGRGQVATILAIALVVNQFGMTSLGRGVSRVVSMHHEPARDVVGAFLPRWIVRAVALGAVAAGVTAVALRGSSGTAVLALECAVVTFLGGVVTLVRSMILGEDRIGSVNRADLTFSTTYVVGVASLFVADRHSVPAVVLLPFIAGQLAWLTLLTRFLAPGTGAVPEPSRRVEVHRFERSAYFSSIGTLDRLGVDTLLISQILGTGAVGLYAVAASIGTLPAVMIGMLSSALLPKMTARDSRDAAALMRRWLLAAALLCTPVVVVIWVLAGPALRIFFGAEFVGATLCTQLLLVANTAFGLRLMLTSAAQAQGRAGRASWISLLGAIGLLAALAVGATIGGLNGAAAAILAASVVSCVAVASVVSWRGSPAGLDAGRTTGAAPYAFPVPAIPPLRQAARLKRRVSWFVRDRFPDRRVVREIQGVRMTLPWSHRLPDYTRGDSPYGQNLVALCRELATGDDPLVVVDIGANVGDSALQVLDAVPARIVCVEADDYYLDFLRENVGADERCRIEHALLVPDGVAATSVAPVREGGTTRFVADDSAEAKQQVTPASLRERHPWTEDLRLVKSDTDGYDVALIPAMAAEWRDVSPVLFFEFDPRLSRLAGNPPEEVWPALAELGYTHVGVWDNGGRPLFRAPVDQMVSVGVRLDDPAAIRAKTYWDVAVVHDSDEAGLRAIEALIPETL